MKIELKKDERRSDPLKGGGKTYKLNPGGFDVFIDGAHWGRFQSVPRGSHGIEYSLRQMHANGAASVVSTEVPSDVNPRLRGGRTTRTAYFDAWSDKTYLRRLAAGAPELNLHDRLVVVATKAIDCGALRDPAVVKAEAEKASANFAARRAEEAAEKKANWDARINVCLDRLYIPEKKREPFREQFRNAMLWAQSQ